MKVMTTIAKVGGVALALACVAMQIYILTN